MSRSCWPSGAWPCRARSCRARSQRHWARLVARASDGHGRRRLCLASRLSVASTVVLVRMLSDHRSLHTPAGHIAVGWLVVEDLFTVILLVLLPPIFGGASESGIGTAILVAALKVAALVVFHFRWSARASSRGSWNVWRRTGSRELFTLTVLVLALGIAVGSAVLFGVSMALGAFLAGLIVGRSDYSLRAASEALPMRDAFAVLFFVSVGMLLDPQYFLQQPLLVLGDGWPSCSSASRSPRFSSSRPFAIRSSPP